MFQVKSLMLEKPTTTRTPSLILTISLKSFDVEPCCGQFGSCLTATLLWGSLWNVQKPVTLKAMAEPTYRKLKLASSSSFSDGLLRILPYKCVAKLCDHVEMLCSNVLAQHPANSYVAWILSTNNTWFWKFSIQICRKLAQQKGIALIIKISMGCPSSPCAASVSCLKKI